MGYWKLDVGYWTFSPYTYPDMTKPPPPRMLRIFWLAALLLWWVVWLMPVSDRVTRAGGLALFCVVWFGLIGLCWRRRAVRFLLGGITLLAAGFLSLPARSHPDVEALRGGFIAGMQRYHGSPYSWGGESPMGIDCSGLIRRGLMDALFCQGIRTGDPGLVRRAMRLWWHDTSARALGEQYDGLTIHLFDAPGINALDHSRLMPGDLAVTRSGVHIMAYLGNNLWIEADPGAGHVIRVTAPSPDNGWFDTPVSLMRWRLLDK